MSPTLQLWSRALQKQGQKAFICVFVVSVTHISCKSHVHIITVMICVLLCRRLLQQSSHPERHDQTGSSSATGERGGGRETLHTSAFVLV